MVAESAASGSSASLPGTMDSSVGKASSAAVSKPVGKVAAAWGAARRGLRRVWDPVAWAANFEWVSVGPKTAASLLALLIIALSLVVGLTAKSVKDSVVLGVEFGGGYDMVYTASQKTGGVPVTDATLSAQAKSMYKDCVSTGHSNCIVELQRPSRIKVVVPGVSTQAEIEPVLAAFAKQPLNLTLSFSTSISGVLGSADLRNSLVAGAVAFGIVWAVLLLRYHAAGVLGLFFTIVFLWLLMVFFNASPSVLSEAAIMALVLNIGLAADSHILTFERSREELHLLPHGAPEPSGLAALMLAQRAALVTILEASATTVIAMFVLFYVGEGPISDFAFMVMISVATSFIVNVLLVRLATRLAWLSGLIRTGAFFGDKGPAYDDEEAKKWSTVRLWRPKRTVKFNFVRFWWIGAAASLAVIIAGSVYLGTQNTHPLNLDVDFTAGTALDLVLPAGDYTADDVGSTAEDATAGEFTVATVALGSGGHANLRFDDVVPSDTVQTIVTAMEDAYGTPVTFVESTVDPVVAVQLVHHGILAIVVAAVVCTVFVTLRFGPGFGVVGFVAMASAGIFSLCCFALGGFEIDVTFIAAVLTVFCYAINDCVVVFDRVRYELESASVATRADLKAVVNGALSRVTIRSLLTLLTVLVCSMCLAYMGAEPLHAFSLAITFGLLSVTYTTLLIIMPLWYCIRAMFMRSPKGSAGFKEGQDADISAQA